VALSAVNRSRALAVLGRGGQDGTSRRFRVRLDVGVAAREDEWDGRSDRVGCWQTSVGGVARMVVKRSSFWWRAWSALVR
jgi:hypothetical protein